MGDDTGGLFHTHLSHKLLSPEFVAPAT